MRILALTSACILALATPGLAEPTVGLGLSFSFGGGAPQTGLGFRVFSDNDRDSFAATAGVDYLFGSGSWRGTVGGAWLGSDTYLGLDLGLGLSGGGLSYGIGAGAAKTEEKKKSVPPAPPA